MSLVRLLTAGKSLVGLKQTGSRYHLTNQRLLPKFEPKKNPFGPGTPDHTAASVLPSPSAPAAESKSLHEALKPATETTKVSAREVMQNRESFLRRLWRWGCSTVGRLRFWRRRSQLRSGARTQPKRLFQAELSLEAVKVVRNDLTDSDFEIVASRAPTDAKRLASVPATAEAALANGRWGKMADRLFGAGKR